LQYIASVGFDRFAREVALGAEMPQPSLDLRRDFAGDKIGNSSPALRGRGTARRAVEGAAIATCLLHAKLHATLAPLHGENE
jgi:hypothetical protein